MKIYVLGPSGVGKTTLAKLLAEKLHSYRCDLDRVFIDFKWLLKTKEIRYRPKKEYLKKIKDVVKRRKWIIEGVYPVEEIMKQADVVIYIKPAVVLALYRQWYRFFTSKFQRQNFGLWNNLGLSKDILWQYFSKFDGSRFGDPLYYASAHTMRLLKSYGVKVKYISTNKDLIRVSLDIVS